MKGVLGLLTVIFIVLKMVGVVAWSWWWVLSPAFIWVLLVLAMFFIAIAAAGSD